MVEVGIPIYNAEDTLTKALDSLVAQTKNNFIVCLSIDGDGKYNIYYKIAQEYIRRGLKIRIINSEKNDGPGIARQRILDTTQCDYIMFLDSDDMFMPRAVEILYGQAKLGNYDIIRSSFIKCFNNADDMLIKSDCSTVTWFHGKIYKVNYLKENDIRFLDGLRADEDAYFNLIAWNCAENRGELSEVTYLWRDNKNSITRSRSERDYFCATFESYSISQIRGLIKIYNMCESVPNELAILSLINIYKYYMRAKFYNLDLSNIDNLFIILSKEKWITNLLNDKDTYCFLIENSKIGDIYDETNIVFYKEDIYTWLMRLLNYEHKK